MPLFSSLLAVGGAIYAYRWLNDEPAPDAQEDASPPQLVPLNGQPALVPWVPEPRPPDDEEKAADTLELRFEMATSSVALALGGKLLLPVLGPLSMVPSLYCTMPLWGEAYRAIVVERKARASVVDIMAISIAVATDSYFALSLGAFFHTFSRKLLMATEDRSRSDLLSVFDKRPRDVWMELDGVEVQVPLENLKIGDTLVVRAGNTIPIDGEISSGVASVDQRMLTGESQPVEKGPGDFVFASTVVISGTIRLVLTRQGEDTVVEQIGKILRETAEYKSSVQTRGERVADEAAGPFLALSALALPLLGPTGTGAVLCSSFGYHLRILGPLGMLNFLTLASRDGILIKDGRSLEILGSIDTVVFDKTGTLTVEQPHVAEIFAYHGFAEDEVLRLAALAERGQNHPIALAIVQEAQARGLSTAATDDVHYEVGYGLEVRLPGQVLHVGSARYMAMQDIAVPDQVKARQVESQQQGHSLIHLGVNGQLVGVIELHATLRSEAKQVVRALRDRGLSVFIISGDHEHPTRRLAEELDIADYFAETLPEDKAKHVAALQKQGRMVCFVGDGINDAVALKQANASISLRGAATVATDAAQIVLLDESLEQLCRVFDLAERFDSNMRLSFAMTIVPSILGLGGAFFAGFGLVQPILLNSAGLALGATNTMLPVMKLHQEEEEARNAAEHAEPVGFS